jgi:hypothetical protein
MKEMLGINSKGCLVCLALSSDRRIMLQGGGTLGLVDKQAIIQSRLGSTSSLQTFMLVHSPPISEQFVHVDLTITS